MRGWTPMALTLRQMGGILTVGSPDLLPWSKSGLVVCHHLKKAKAVVLKVWPSCDRPPQASACHLGEP
jgi:hypothetical protein